jgi:hypothetical protein
MFFVVCPPFRIVPIDELQNHTREQGFDAVSFAESFFEDDIPNALDQTVEAGLLLTAVRENPAKARERFGVEFGIGETYYYFVSGQGVVSSVSKKSVEISIPGNSNSDEFRISTANIFGNTIRNGTGLLDVSDFPNSRDFNAVSQELNRLVETRVLPPFRDQVESGQTVSFAGCIEINNEQEKIVLIPIFLEIVSEP